jgi:hypothetical protein
VIKGVESNRSSNAGAGKLKKTDFTQHRMVGRPASTIFLDSAVFIEKKRWQIEKVRNGGEKRYHAPALLNNVHSSHRHKIEDRNKMKFTLFVLFLH